VQVHFTGHALSFCEGMTKKPTSKQQPQPTRHSGAGRNLNLIADKFNF